MAEAPARKRLPPEARRQQILDAAAPLFVSRGFEAVGMADVAEALGVSRPTVYKYFPSTEAMVDALFEQGLAKLWPKLAPFVVPQPEGKAERLAACFRLLLEEGELLALLHSGGGPRFQARRAALVQGRMEALMGPLLPPERRPYTVAMVCFLVEGMAHWASQDPSVDAEALCASLATFISQGVVVGGCGA